MQELQWPGRINLPTDPGYSQLSLDLAEPQREL